MRHRLQPRHDLGGAAGREHEGIATGEDDLADLRLRGEIGEGGLQHVAGQRRRLAGTDHLAAEAEAAIDRAG